MSLEPTSYAAKYLLAQAIVTELEKEFEEIYLSGNLVNTIQINANGENLEIEIPATVYDMALWKRKHVIVYKNLNESYATEVEEKGGFSHRHINFVEKAVSKAISKWTKEINKKCEIKEEGNSNVNQG